MKKLIKKRNLAFVMFLVLIAGVYASHWIYSNIVAVEVGGYALSLSWDVEGNEVTLNASLIRNAKPQSDANITFYECDNSGVTISTLGSNLTNLEGYAVYSLTATNGTHYYKAGCWIE